MFRCMKELDLHRIAEDQVVAHPIALRPLAEVDEAGAESPTLCPEVAFRIGDTIVVMGERAGQVLAYKNYGSPPHYGLPPYVFKKEEVQQVSVQE